MTEKPRTFFNSGDFTPASPAIITKDQTVTYEQLIKNIHLCGNAIKSDGIKQGSRVAICAATSAEYITFLLSLWSIKAIACPMNTRLPEPAINEQINALKADAVIQGHIPAGTGKPAAHLTFDGNCPATIIYTSGSSGEPKAALHTLNNHIYNAMGSQEIIPLSSGDNWLLSLPLYHVGGLSVIFRSLMHGAALSIPDPNTSLLESIQSLQPTHISLVPTQLKRLLDQDPECLSTLKVILLGGSAIPSSLLEHCAERCLPIYTTYGSTEMASQIATGKYPAKAKLLKCASVTVRENGDVWAKGEALFQGYVSGTKIISPLNREGWFETGDLGALNGDELEIIGRKDNMFISGGENIHPEEIERAIYALPSVEQAAVVAIPHIDYGFRPVCFIQIKKGVEWDTWAIEKHLGQCLPKYKIPDHFYPWPTDISIRHGKISRSALTEKAKARSESAP